MPKHIAAYVRVSSAKQDTKSQEPDLERWIESNADGLPVVWYRDKATGKSMERPGWRKLESQIDQGQVSRVIVWRLDRLGRTAAGLTALFEKLIAKRVGLTSLKDGLDLQTAAGRLMANVLASVAAFETEIRAERVLAGQAVARAAGKTWGGSEKGKRRKVSPTQTRIIRDMQARGEPITSIAAAVGLSRPTIYSVLKG